MSHSDRQAAGILLRGIGASQGIAIGHALVYQPQRAASSNAAPAASIVPDTGAEHARLHTALAAAAKELRALADNVRHEVDAAAGEIFEAQALMLEDPTLSERADGLIDDERCAAIDALHQAVEEQAGLLASLPDPIWQARAADIRDAGVRVQSHLRPVSEQAPTLASQLAALADPVIVVARDLAPSETASMRGNRVLGIALAEGSATAHAAILARALGIPAVVGIGSTLLETVQADDTLVVDASLATVMLRPDSAEIEQARQSATRYAATMKAQRARMSESRERPGHTRDGHHVAILANVGSLPDAQAAAAMGAEGIGLLRTEFLFAQHASLPGVEEQAAIYGEIIDALGTRNASVTIRTLDAGTDKPLDSLTRYTAQLPVEVNSALGVRGIRLHHRFPELLTVQLQAVLAAGARTQARLRIMLPMVDTVKELREAKSLLQTAYRAQKPPDGASTVLPPLGIMVETPAAVLMARALARDAAFFSIGTNDLTQYVMAADRLNPELAYIAQPTDPAIIRAIAMVAQSAGVSGRSVSVCGEMAADPRLALLLVGLGITELSMMPASIPFVKQALAAHTQAELHAVAERALQAATRTEVEQIVEQLALE
jgi:phosphoenolpyruvate-protein phosphotransferase